jgi:hypothetical protein
VGKYNCCTAANHVYVKQFFRKRMLKQYHS